MNACRGIFGLIFGHNYCHAFNTVETERARVSDNVVFLTAETEYIAWRPLDSSTYVCSICSRCGHHAAPYVSLGAGQ